MTGVLSWQDTGQVSEQLALLRQASPGIGELRVALVYGGMSAEDRLYIARCPADQMTITALTRTLAGLGARSLGVLDPCSRSFTRDLLEYDVIIPSVHGPYGEDGRLQGLLDYVGRPYSCSGVAACAVTADKALCKLAMAGLGVVTPRWHLPGADGSALAASGPVMVKPRAGGSSVGMTLVSAAKDLDVALQDATAQDPVGALIEEYIPGLPVTVGLLELPGAVLVLPPLAVQTSGTSFYDAETKLDAAGGHPAAYGAARLPAPVLNRLQADALTLWSGLGCRGAARVDFITAGSDTFALEVNATPGLSDDSNFVTAARLAAVTTSDIVRALISQALRTRAPDCPLPVLAAADLSPANPAVTLAYRREKVNGSGVPEARPADVPAAH
jgi:D-alanine-D-alanine ligase